MMPGDYIFLIILISNFKASYDYIYLIYTLSKVKSLKDFFSNDFTA